MISSVLAIVIVYHPEEDLLLENISSFVGGVDKVWIWQNSPISAELKQRLQSSLPHTRAHTTENSSHVHKIEFVGNGQNMGISKALNEAYRFARREGYRYLLSMDQDSVWKDFNAFLTYVNTCICTTDNEAKLCLCGPTLDDEVVGGKHEEVHHLITSGMLVPVELLNKTGGYCEDFVVDGIDVELSLRARSFGYPSYRLYGSKLIHKMGYVEKRKVFGRTVETVNYSPFRLKGIVRNHLLILRMYPHQPAWFNRRVWRKYICRFACNIILAESDKVAKLTAIFTGLLSGLFSKKPVIPKD